MFEKIEPLKRDTHLDLKFTPADNYSFAGKMAVSPVSFSEIIKAAMSYPVVFPSQGPLIPQALLSVIQGQNRFVDGNGAWGSAYIPAHVRRYPFILAAAEGQDDPDRMMLCIDRAAPQFSTDQGEPLYTAGGEPSEFLKKTISFLQKFHSELQQTAKLFSQLAEKDLLTDIQFNIGGTRENPQTIKGGRAVNRDRLKELDDATLAAWVKNGLMELVYAHLHSLENIKGLV